MPLDSAPRGMHSVTEALKKLAGNRPLPVAAEVVTLVPELDINQPERPLDHDQLTEEETKGKGPVAVPDYSLDPDEAQELDAYGSRSQSNTRRDDLERQKPAKSRVRTTQQLTNFIQAFVEAGGQDPLWTLMEIQAGYRLIRNAKGKYVQVKFEKPPDFKVRAFAAAEIASYIYPKRKAVEVSAGEGQPITFNVVADASEIPQMPSDEEIAKLRLERAQAARTIPGN